MAQVQHFAQRADSSNERTQNAEPPSGTPGFSELREYQEEPHAQVAAKEPGCRIRGFSHETWTEASQFGHGLKAVPRSAVRLSNLKWELPILAATGVMIAKVDRPADNRIQSKSLQQTARHRCAISASVAFSPSGPDSKPAQPAFA